MATTTENKLARRGTWWLLWAFLILVVYVLSSGPVLAVAFWLREATGNNAFYSAMWLYYPLLYLGQGHHGVLMQYIEWWVVDVFDTVGPG